MKKLRPHVCNGLFFHVCNCLDWGQWEREGNSLRDTGYIYIHSISPDFPSEAELAEVVCKFLEEKKHWQKSKYTGKHKENVRK